MPHCTAAPLATVLNFIEQLTKEYVKISAIKINFNIKTMKSENFDFTFLTGFLTSLSFLAGSHLCEFSNDRMASLPQTLSHNPKTSAAFFKSTFLILLDAANDFLSRRLTSGWNFLADHFDNESSKPIFLNSWVADAYFWVFKTFVFVLHGFSKPVF